MTPDYFYIAGSRRLFACAHGVKNAPRAATVFCHPLGEEKKCAHRAFHETARALAAAGVASLLFDLSGCGDSEGEFSEFSLADWIADVNSAIEEMRRRTPDVPLVLVGLRLGAALAAMAAAEPGYRPALSLWQPMVDGRAEFTAELRRLLIQQMMVSGKAGASREEIVATLEAGTGEVALDGYAITGRLYKDICAIDLAAMKGDLSQRTRIVQFSRQDRRIEAFAQTLGTQAAVVDVPPIWTRSDFMPTSETGALLAREGILRLIEETT